MHVSWASALFCTEQPSMAKLKLKYQVLVCNDVSAAHCLPKLNACLFPTSCSTLLKQREPQNLKQHVPVKVLDLCQKALA